MPCGRAFSSAYLLPDQFHRLIAPVELTVEELANDAGALAAMIARERKSSPGTSLQGDINFMVHILAQKKWGYKAVCANCSFLDVNGIVLLLKMPERSVFGKVYTLHII